MKLYSIQIKLASPEENLRKVLNFLEKTEKNSLVLLPEMWYSGFDYENLHKHAENTRRVISILKKISLRKRLLIVGTYPYLLGGRIYNMALLIEDGRITGKRGKIRLFPIFDEDKHFTPWRENRVFKTKFGKVGILICFEIRFTDLILELQKERPDIVLVPAQWGWARREHLSTLSRARAVEMQSYLLLSNTWGEHLGTRFAGRSAIYSPWGEILSYSETGDTLLEAEYDLAYVERVRKAVPVKI